MRIFDFAPLYRSTVGFDRMFSLLDQLGGVEGSVPSYPPYNIAQSQSPDSPTLTFRSKRRKAR